MVCLTSCGSQGLPVYTVGPGALRAGTLTVDSAASPSASLATLSN